MSKKYRVATGNRVLRAYNKAVRNVVQENLLACSIDAGFIMPAKWAKGEGYQVFVRVVRFSEQHLKDDPMTGGLLA